MSAKWRRSQAWDDRVFPAWAWPAKAVLRAFRVGDAITAKAWQGGLLRELKISAEDDLTVFSRACEQGDALGCFEARARLEARGTTSGDAAEAVSFFERGWSCHQWLSLCRIYGAAISTQTNN